MSNKTLSRLCFNWYIYSYSTYAEASGLQEAICMNIWMEDQEPKPLWKPNNNFLVVVTVIKKFNPLHPNISIQILHTVLCTFTKVLTGRICLTIKSFFSCWSFPLFSWHWCVIQWWYCKEKLDASHS